MSRYHVIACDVLETELLHFGERCDADLSFEFMEQGLHNEPDRLRAEVSEAVLRAPDEAEATLLGYGLCSNGIQGIAAHKHPLVVPRAHDCVTLFLGSRGRYQEYYDRNPGTYWYTPGWIATGTQPSEERYRQARQAYVEQYGEENADYLMEMTEGGWTKHYQNAAYVNLGIGDPKADIEFTKECADFFGWSCDVIQGDPSLLLKFLGGEWDEEDFLVVQPGESIIASHDGRVLGVAK
ncbi:MAG: DUF1638 domain-containing protein [Armatimonadia bacterium]|nr:DUF1638 domain-containing protein [Armatimonadia bacterium]